MGSFKRGDGVSVVWRAMTGLTPYDQVMSSMLETQQLIIDGKAREQVWVLQSPAGYSRGRQADRDDDVGAQGLAVDASPRSHVGGYWYHGPGEVGVVVLLDLRSRRKSVPGIYRAVSDWIASSLQLLGANVVLRDDAPGVWLAGKKVAAVALSLQSWVTAFGAGINLNPEPAAFSKIRPCRSDACDVTSLWQSGVRVTFDETNAALREMFHQTFGWTSDAP